MEVGKLVFTADPGGLPMYNQPQPSLTREVKSEIAVCEKEV